jgi:hypothetical protein
LVRENYNSYEINSYEYMSIGLFNTELKL